MAFVSRSFVDGMSCDRSVLELFEVGDLGDANLIHLGGHLCRIQGLPLGVEVVLVLLKLFLYLDLIHRPISVSAAATASISTG